MYSSRLRVYATTGHKVAALILPDKSLSEEEFALHYSAIEYTIEKLETTVSWRCFYFRETAMAHVQVPFNNILYFETSPTPIHKVILHTKGWTIRVLRVLQT